MVLYSPAQFQTALSFDGLQSSNWHLSSGMGHGRYTGFTGLPEMAMASGDPE
jgi:hypothetical protein